MFIKRIIFTAKMLEFIGIVGLQIDQEQLSSNVGNFGKMRG